jgi:hypothetical protein
VLYLDHTPKGIEHKVGRADINTAELVRVAVWMCVCVCMCIFFLWGECVCEYE